MLKTNFKYIRSLNQFVKEIGILVKDSPKGFYLFRGQGNHGNEIQSGAYRRIEIAYGKANVTVRKIIEYHEKIIENTRNRSESHSLIKDKCDMIVVGEIQHYGGATNLIDFTFNSLIALYFACKSKGDKNKSSKVYCLNTDSTDRFKEINSKDLQNPENSFSVLIDKIENTAGNNTLNRFYKWIPPIGNYRITKQDSVFIFNGKGVIYDDEFEKIFLIRKANKSEILNELEKNFYISEETLFPDFIGYVEANSSGKSLSKIDANYYFKKAYSTQQKGEDEKAIDYYRKVLSVNPNNYSAWYNMGIAYAVKEDLDETISCNEEALKIQPKLPGAWYNMGTAFLLKNNYVKAIDCFEKTVQINPMRDDAWHNMGIAYSKKGENEKANECFSKEDEVRETIRKKFKQ